MRDLLEIVKNEVAEELDRRRTEIVEDRSLTSLTLVVYVNALTREVRDIVFRKESHRKRRSR